MYKGFTEPSTTRVAFTFLSPISFYVKPLFCCFHKFIAVIAAVPSNPRRAAAGWSEEALIRVLQDSSVSAQH